MLVISVRKNCKRDGQCERDGQCAIVSQGGCWTKKGILISSEKRFKSAWQQTCQIGLKEQDEGKGCFTRNRLFC